MFFVVKLLKFDYDSLVQTICFNSSMLSKTYVFCGIVVGDALLPTVSLCLTSGPFKSGPSSPKRDLPWTR